MEADDLGEIIDRDGFPIEPKYLVASPMSIFDRGYYRVLPMLRYAIGDPCLTWWEEGLLIGLSRRCDGIAALDLSEKQARALNQIAGKVGFLG